MNSKKIVLLTTFLLIAISTFPQMIDPVNWSFVSKKTAPNEYQLIFKSEVEDGWKAYPLVINPDPSIIGGPIPTIFNFDKNSAFQIIGKPKENSKIKMSYDSMFEMDVRYYSHKGKFSQKVKLLKPTDKIKGFIEYMCCDDKQCIPVEADFVFDVTYEEVEDEESTESSAEIEVIDAGTSGPGIIADPIHWSYELKELDNDDAELIFTAEIDEKWHLYSAFLDEGGPRPTIFSIEENENIEVIGDIIEKSEVEEIYDSNFEMKVRFFSEKAVFVQKIKIKKKVGDIKVSVEYMSCDDKQCLPPAEKDITIPLGEPVSATGGESKSLWGFFILALLTGFLGVLTPCVYPMIPMTVSFFMSGTKKKSKARAQGIFYGISIIFIYTAIGLIIAATLGPDAISLLSTHWVPNILFFLLFTVFAASFFGMFEIVLPNKLVNRADKQADRGGYLGTFFMALTLVLVSFSCTAPFIGGLLIEAAQGVVIKPVVGMLGFSIAFALPFTILAFFPAWLGKLPQSGGWMNTVKVVLAFLILALGMKYLAAADNAYHWGILPRDVFIAIWIVIFTLLGLYLLGKIKFAHDSDLKHVSVPRLLMIIASFSFAVYLIPGLFGAPLKGIAALIPPESSHSFNLKTMIMENAGSSVSNNQESQAICGESKYADFLDLPHGLKGYFDYEQGLACAKEQNKPIFLVFMGHACAKCHEMEAKVWPDPGVMKLLRDEFVIIALYVDDKTDLPESEWTTAKYDDKVKKTIGKKNLAFQIDNYKTNGQPFYHILNPDEESLQSTYQYDLNIDNLIEYLKIGIENFKKDNPL